MNYRRSMLVAAAVTGAGLLTFTMSSAPSAVADPDDAPIEVSMAEDGVTLHPHDPSSGQMTRFQWDPGAQQLAPLQESKSPQINLSSDGQDVVEVWLQTDASGRVTERSVAHLDSQISESGQSSTQWTTSPNSFSMAWWNPEGAPITWQVSRDGKNLGTTYSNQWTDSVSQAVSHQYVVTGSREVFVEGKVETQPYYYEINTTPPNQLVIGKLISDPDIFSNKFNLDLARYHGDLSLSYRAFIPGAYLAAPLFPCQVTRPSVAYYGGDSRGFANNMYEYHDRSRAQISTSVTYFADGTSEHPPIYRYVGATKTYDNNHRLLETKNAGLGGLSESNVERTGSYAEGTIRISASNPLCTGAPAIDATMYWKMNASGEFRTKGDHDQAPNHEVMYIWNENGREKTGCVFKHTVIDYNHLLPPYPNATYDITWNPKQGTAPRC